MKAVLLIGLLVVLGIGIFLFAGTSPETSGGHTPHSMQPE